MTDRPPHGKIQPEIGLQCRLLELTTDSSLAPGTRWATAWRWRPGVFSSQTNWRTNLRSPSRSGPNGAPFLRKPDAFGGIESRKIGSWATASRVLEPDRKSVV